MLHRTSMKGRIAAAVFAALVGTTGIAWAAPADDLKEAQKLYAAGKVQPAMDKVDAVLKAQPKDPQARFLKGLLLTEQKKVTEAIRLFLPGSGGATRSSNSSSVQILRDMMR